MRILLDHCVDVKVSELLLGHEVRHTAEMGWQQLSNGKLLDQAEVNGFQAMVTVDKNVRHQQNIAKRHICLITLSPTLVDLEYLRPLVPKLLQILEAHPSPGSVIVITQES